MNAKSCWSSSSTAAPLAGGGGSGNGDPPMVSVTLSGTLRSVPSFTTSWNVRTVVTDGATNDGATVPAPVRTTLGPPDCVHAYDSGSPSGSVLAEPSSATTEPRATTPSAPASETGRRSV